MSIETLFGRELRARTIVLVCLALALVTALVYLRVLGNDFVNCDDYEYVVNNPHVASGLTGNNSLWAFTAVDAANWHPVTWLSHMTDVQIYGMDPRGHHVTSVIIHVISSLLLLLLLFRLTGSFLRSALVAALFALHPMHVESVAWVAERKDVLSAFFCFLTLFLYAGFAARRKPMLYLLSLCMFLLGLMSKPMLVTLPVVLLLLDFWPLGRYRNRETSGQRGDFLRKLVSLAWEKAPFFALSFLSCLITFYAQNNGGATRSFGEVAPLLRIENSLVSYLMYLVKTLWPLDLAVMYPFPASIALWQAVGSLAALLVISGASILARRRHPYLLVGWFWFLITLVPVIGLIQVGEQAMADRYSYLPGIGLFIMIAWGVADALKNVRGREAILALSAATALVASALLSWQQLGYWRDSAALFQHANRVSPDSYVIHKYLGAALVEKNDIEGAIREYQEALRLNPEYATAHNNLGAILAGKGDQAGAIREYLEALRINPKLTLPHMNLGVVLAGKGKLDEAIHQFQLYLARVPDNPLARVRLGIALGDKGELDAGIGQFREALRINPGFADAHNSLGIALAKKGDFETAIPEFKEALRIEPDNRDAQTNLATALESWKTK